MKVKIAKWGNSLAVRLPKTYASELGLAEGSEVELERKGKRLALSPVPAAKIPHYRLEDLLAQIDRLGPGNEPGTVEWGPDRGTEIIDDEYSRGEITLDDVTSGRLRDKDASGGR